MPERRSTRYPGESDQISEGEAEKYPEFCVALICQGGFFDGGSGKTLGVARLKLC